MPTTTTTDSSSIHFPTAVPRKEQPNAHPYAIKTSSTAILSRSTSHASAWAAAHHYVPAPSSPQGSSGSPVINLKQHHLHHRRHRYSRSLTSDAPPALPIPPGAGVAGAPFSNDPAPPPPTKAHFSDAEDAPRRRGHRADTLPASSLHPAPLPPQSLDVDDDNDEELIPDDPKTWTPSQLSRYLSSKTLKAGGDVKVPTPVARDIAKFVGEKGITGKMFLRLCEDDLVEFGINQLWRTTLLAASRNLRQTILRGRIWGFGNVPDEHDELRHQQQQLQEHEDGGHFSSSSSSSSLSDGKASILGLGRRRRKQSRHVVHSSSGSGSGSGSGGSSNDHNRLHSNGGGGRVKDMIDTLENAAPDGLSSSSPTKLSSGRRDSFTFASNRHQPHSAAGVRANAGDASPTKPTPSAHQHQHQHRVRLLPQRGSVSDLFNPPKAAAAAAMDANGDSEEDEDEDDTIGKNTNFRGHHHHHQQENQNHGREPRMLPPLPTNAPPTMTMTPMHTGAGYPLPMSSEHTGTMFSELGYRNGHTNLFLNKHLGGNGNGGRPRSPPSMNLNANANANPNSQVFVVRHNPASPSNNVRRGPYRHIGNGNDNDNDDGIAGGSGSGTRLLPYPPVMGETELYHPMPRRLIGDLDSNPNSGVGGGVVEASGQEENDGERQMSVEELLAVDGRSEDIITTAPASATNGKNKPISGVDAWEFGIGETVKRIGGGDGVRSSSSQYLHGGHGRDAPLPPVPSGRAADSEEREENGSGLAALFRSPDEGDEASPPPSAGLDCAMEEVVKDDVAQVLLGVERRPEELQLVEGGGGSRMDVKEGDKQEEEEEEERRTVAAQLERERELERREREVESREEEVGKREAEVEVRERGVSLRDKEREVQEISTRDADSSGTTRPRDVSRSLPASAVGGRHWIWMSVGLVCFVVFKVVLVVGKRRRLGWWWWWSR